MGKFQQQIVSIQKSLHDHQLSGWLLHDFRHSNELALNFLKISSETKLTRRFFYWIPQIGEAVKIVSIVEPYVLEHLPGEKWVYKEWSDLQALLASICRNSMRIAMEYSPLNALPTISKVDAGTVELVEQFGAKVVSSANLLQTYTSVLTPEQIKSHRYAANVLEEVVKETWIYIQQSLKQEQIISEYDVQQFMLKLIDKKGCVTQSAPTCATNIHSADPHYSPTQENASIIKKEDFILLDLWCKQKESSSIYADITRVGVAAAESTNEQNTIFNSVRKAQKSALSFIKERIANKKVIEGWEVDRLCRSIIQEEGYGDFFIHRTGHNLGEEVHGPGANLDDFETHDNRELIPGTVFTIEPGIYLPHEPYGFGVRLEFDVYLGFDRRVEVTNQIQEKIVCLKI